MHYPKVLDSVYTQHLLIGLPYNYQVETSMTTRRKSSQEEHEVTTHFLKPVVRSVFHVYRFKVSRSVVQTADIKYLEFVAIS